MRDFLAIVVTFAIGVVATMILAYSLDYHQMSGTVAQRPAVPADMRTVLPSGFTARPAHQAHAPAPAIHGAKEI